MAHDDRPMTTQFYEWCFAMFVAPFILWAIVWLICKMIFWIIGE